MDGHKDSKGNFHPHSDSSKKLSSHQVNTSKADIIDEIKAKELKNKKYQGSDLYNAMVNSYPHSSVGSDVARWKASDSLGSHGGFGDALKEGDYAKAMYKADGHNLVLLKNLGIEHHLSKTQHHPDDPSDYDEFKQRYEWALRTYGNPDERT